MMSCWMITAWMHDCGKDSIKEESHNPSEIMIQTLRNRPGGWHITSRGAVSCAAFQNHRL